METATPRRPTPERAWLELYAELTATPPRSLPVERLACQLRASFDASLCAYVDVRDDAVHAATVRPSLPWAGADRHPLVRFHLDTGRCVPLQVADLPAGTAAAGPGEPDGGVPGGPHQLSLPLELAPGTLRAFLLGRPRPYEPPEMALALTLWRLLLGLDRQVDATARDTSAEPAGPAAPGLGLTPREAGVLALLGDGLTASAIARRLRISVRTVHKHLERIYLKLGVTDRLSAVLQARERHLL